ncbi:MAG: hypothetical protein JWQ57_4166 [Mucilaginibacter sp.]|nr:hypothetical protein [Mucilaginibacter sp.]
MILFILLCTIMNFYSAYGFYKKREKYLEMSVRTTEPEEQDALRSVANNQIWKMILFGIVGFACFMLLLMILTQNQSNL